MKTGHLAYRNGNPEKVRSWGRTMWTDGHGKPWLGYQIRDRTTGQTAAVASMFDPDVERRFIAWRLIGMRRELSSLVAAGPPPAS